MAAQNTSRRWGPAAVASGGRRGLRRAWVPRRDRAGHLRPGNVNIAAVNYYFRDKEGLYGGAEVRPPGGARTHPPEPPAGDGVSRRATASVHTLAAETIPGRAVPHGTATSWRARSSSPLVLSMRSSSNRSARCIRCSWASSARWSAPACPIGGSASVPSAWSASACTCTWPGRCFGDSIRNCILARGHRDAGGPRHRLLAGGDPQPSAGGPVTMNRVAIKMLVGDRAKYLASSSGSLSRRC